MILIALCLNGFDCKPYIDGAESDGESIRLPGNTRPVNYDIELNVGVHDGSTSYTGKVRITIAIDVASDVITLHSKGLTVIEVKVLDKASELVGNTHVLDPALDFLIVTVERLLAVGDEYILEISFTGDITETSTSGFYRMSYRDVETNEMR